MVDELELRLAAERLRQERDLSQQLKSELNSFFALSVDLFCIADANGTFTHVNPAWEKVLGFSANELTAQPFLAFVHPDDREATLHAMRHLPDDGALAGFENRYRSKSGAYRWLSWSAQINPVKRLAVRASLDGFFLSGASNWCVGRAASTAVTDDGRVIKNMIYARIGQLKDPTERSKMSSMQIPSKTVNLFILYNLYHRNPD